MAEQVEELDDELDELHVTLTAEIASGSMPLPVAIEAALVARFYERFGDHAVNLARRIAVMVGRATTGATERLAPEPLSSGRARPVRRSPGQQGLGDLHGVEGGALAQVVARHEERQSVGDACRRAAADPRAPGRCRSASSGVGTST